MKMIAAVLLMVGSVMAGADRSDWNNLQILKAGERVGVIQSNLKRVEGTFGGFNDTGLTLDGTTLAKDQVVRVFKFGGGLNRGTRALIGAGIGVALGAVITQTAGKRFENEGAKFGGIEDAGWYAISIGSGAAIGALSGGGYQTIYQRK